MKIYFLIPLFNEAENIPELARNLIESMNNHDKFYVFVDDYSTDKTILLLEKEFQKTNYHIIAKSKNCGPGDSFDKGFNWIINDASNPNDIIVTLEGDNTSDLSILPKMLAISQMDTDLILASVYAQGGGFEKTNFIRKFLSFFANMIFRSIFDIKILTLSSFYRVYKVSLIKKIKERYKSIINETGFISMLEILLKAINLEASIIEVPMKLNSSKRKGQSKMKIFKTGYGYLRFLVKQKISEK